MFPSNLRSRNCQRPDPQKEIVASDHVNRTPKGRTHGSTDQACDVKISLANPEPSTHDPKSTLEERQYPHCAARFLQFSSQRPIPISRIA